MTPRTDLELDPSPDDEEAWDEPETEDARARSQGPLLWRSWNGEEAHDNQRVELSRAYHVEPWTVR